MALSQGHPLALFRLEPLGQHAKNTVADASNRHLVSIKNGQVGLDIGGIPSAVNDGVTLATLGRNGDVHIFGSSVARIQCSFEVDLATQVVMFYDKSHNHSTQVHGDSNNESAVVIPFELGRPRKVFIGKGVNPVIGMCGVNRDIIRFRLVWSANSQEAIENKIQSRQMKDMVSVPYLAKTIDDTETIPETTRITRMHTPALGQTMLIRPHKLQEIGAGAFGVVSKVVNADTGKIMALKILKRAPFETQAGWKSLQREVEILAKLNHPCIVDLIWSQKWDTNEAEIYMGLKDGSLYSLLLGGSYAQGPSPVSFQSLVNCMFHNMLQALDALACQNIIHRDIKPENIFYLRRDGQYLFQLGDFGLSNTASSARTYAGSKLYMAPEVHHGQTQTTKADIWSLYVTVLWTLDYGEFRKLSQSFRHISYAHEAILALAAEEGNIADIREMAIVDPGRRASAAQMLCKHYGGRGLVTPPHQVPPLLAPAPQASAPQALAAPRATAAVGTTPAILRAPPARMLVPPAAAPVLRPTVLPGTHLRTDPAQINLQPVSPMPQPGLRPDLQPALCGVTKATAAANGDPFTRRKRPGTAEIRRQFVRENRAALQTPLQTTQPSDGFRVQKRRATGKKTPLRLPSVAESDMMSGMIMDAQIKDSVELLHQIPGSFPAADGPDG